MNEVALSPQLAPPTSAPVGHAGARIEISERPAWAPNGWYAVAAIGGCIAALVALALSFARVWSTAGGAEPSPATVAPFALGVFISVAVAAVLGTSLNVVQPGETRVVQFFGRYVGTVRRTGLVMTVPFSTRRRVTVRVHNFETARLKVNDADGNPVDVGAIIVWQVADTAKSVFAVEDYQQFNEVQAEAALRQVVGGHPYDNTTEHGTSLRGSTDQVAAELAHEVAVRVAVAGIEIIECRISHLAYSKEIAGAMLQRQQANAVVAARGRIVEGAVGMVEMALARLSERDIVELDDERRAAMVSNLLVVLCGDSRATPVVNTGTLYG
jgi:regulator of protease activity HflC (stomatin/prohibitin superfamily)